MNNRHRRGRQGKRHFVNERQSWGAWFGGTSLYNATARVPIDADSLRPELIVADVVFNPPETWLIRAAADRGCRTIDGLGMLVNQAVISFKIWTGIETLYRDDPTAKDILEQVRRDRAAKK